MIYDFNMLSKYKNLILDENVISRLYRKTLHGWVNYCFVDRWSICRQGENKDIFGRVNLAVVVCWEKWFMVISETGFRPLTNKHTGVTYQKLPSISPPDGEQSYVFVSITRRKSKQIFRNSSHLHLFFLDIR
jgi:hypothetical protein